MTNEQLELMKLMPANDKLISITTVPSSTGMERVHVEVQNIFDKSVWIQVWERSVYDFGKYAFEYKGLMKA